MHIWHLVRGLRRSKRTPYSKYHAPLPYPCCTNLPRYVTDHIRILTILAIFTVQTAGEALNYHPHLHGIELAICYKAYHLS